MGVASGRHFLSDVVFAGLFMLIIARLLYKAFRVTAPQGKGLLRAILADVFGVGRSAGPRDAALSDVPGTGAAAAQSQRQNATIDHV